MKKNILLIVYLLFSVYAAKSQVIPGYKLIAEYRDSSFQLCGGTLCIDTSGYIFLSDGCEQHTSFLFDRCHINNDTIWIDRYNFQLNSPFFKIIRAKTTSANQQIKFLSIDGMPMQYRFDHEPQTNFATARTIKGRVKKLNLINGEVTFKNGSISVMELHLLSRLFNVPVTFWVKAGYSYTVIINLPHDLLSNYCIHGARNFKEKFLVIKDNTVYFPERKWSIKISYFN